MQLANPCYSSLKYVKLSHVFKQQLALFQILEGNTPESTPFVSYK